MQNKTSSSTFGPDLNEFKENVDFRVLASTVDFIYLRSSGSGTGSFRVDKKFIEYARGCRNYGIPVGAYHFGVPSSDLSTADSQCDDFINVLQQGFGQGDYGDIFPTLDIESPIEKTITTAELVRWIDRFRKRFEQKTRRRLMLYTGLFFIKIYDDFKVNNSYPLSNMPLWIAMYKEIPGNPPYPPDIGGWKRWTIWQFTEQGNIKGVDPPVDLNWGPNSIDELKPPSNVSGLSASMDKNYIYVTWNANRDKDLMGYNIYVNSNYIKTLGKGVNYYRIPRSTISVPINRPIEIGVEAFDSSGEFSKNRSKVTLTQSRGEPILEEDKFYIKGDIIIRT
ncbi:glycoside hydrolase family 25 protein [Clostridium fallax]|uniref:Lysozyme n=1 Tax=Clostridium fallax TaxID=1533 RepID=A0A1M4SQL2_9CLOT|nr:glycoside hydrolase family 25 protein [Clostridium fallax]SHE34469.1 lysozyme [Clostridium fallax]SQB07931.1 muramidase [Clostridium fallax]